MQKQIEHVLRTAQVMLSGPTISRFQSQGGCCEQQPGVIAGAATSRVLRIERITMWSCRGRL